MRFSFSFFLFSCLFFIASYIYNCYCCIPLTKNQMNMRIFLWWTLWCRKWKWSRGKKPWIDCAQWSIVDGYESMLYISHIVNLFYFVQREKVTKKNDLNLCFSRNLLFSDIQNMKKETILKISSFRWIKLNS